MVVVNNRQVDRRERLLESLKSRLGVDGLVDSPVAMLAEIVGNEIESIEREMYNYFYSININNAIGGDLDVVAASDHNYTRIPATRARSSKFSFYVLNENTFGSINDGNDITIPVGTLIGVSYPVENSNIVFKTTSEVVLRSDLTEISFYGESTTVGEEQNVTELSLNYHNFTNYKDYAKNLLKITNTEAITNGSEEETDESLRTRCAGQNQVQVERNKNFIFLALLEETDVYASEIIESYYGIGTVGVIVKGNGGGKVSDDTIARLEDTIAQEAKHLGQKVIFSKGLKVKFKIEIECIAFNRNFNDVDKTNLENDIKSFIYENIKQQEFSSRTISFRLLQEDIKTRFNVKQSSNLSSLFVKIEKQVDDEDYGSASVETLNINSSFVLNRDEYVGTDMDIAASVL